MRSFTNYEKRVHFSASEEMLSELDVLCERKKVSRAFLIRTAVAAYLEKERGDKT